MSDQHHWQQPNGPPPYLPDRPLYEDGLEVAPSPRPEDGLEVVPSTAPEWTSSSGQESSLGHKIVVESEPEFKSETAQSPYKKDNEAGLEPVVGTTPRPWYKRKLILGLIAAALALGIGLGVGLGVGLTAGGDDSSNGSKEGNSGAGGNDGNGNGNGTGNDDTDGGPCGGFCFRLLAVNIHYDELYVLGRSKDKNTITYTTYDGRLWTQWRELEKPPSTPIIGPPTAQNWAVNGNDSLWRLDVFVVTESDTGSNTVYNNWLTAKEDWPEWKDIEGDVGSQVVTCAIDPPDYEARLDVWAIDREFKNITKTDWTQIPPHDLSEEALDGVTAEHGEFDVNWRRQDGLGKSDIQPAVLCPTNPSETQRFHDVMWYGQSGREVFHSSYTLEDEWSEIIDYRAEGGKWIGDPSLFSLNDDKTDGYFFGVQEDHHLYHVSWDEDGEFSSNGMENLGGDIYSNPALVSEGDVVDIVALGGNGTLVHKHRDRTGWDDEWEDLEIESAGTPYLRVFMDKMWLLALTKDGELMAWSRTFDPGQSTWKESLSEGQPVNGELTLDTWPN